MDKAAELYTKALEIITNEQERIAVGKLIGEIIEIESDGSIAAKDPNYMTKQERENECKRLNDLVTLKMLNMQLLQVQAQEEALKEKKDPVKECAKDSFYYLKKVLEAAGTEGKYALVRDIAEVIMAVNNDVY